MRKGVVVPIMFALTLAAAMYAQSGSMGQGPSDGQSGMGRSGQGAHHMPTVEDQVNNLDKQLKLTDDQKTQVRSILQNQHDQMQQLMQDSSLSRDEKRSKMQEMHQTTSGKIRELLNDDQKKKFDDYEQKRQQQMQQHHHGG